MWFQRCCKCFIICFLNFCDKSSNGKRESALKEYIYHTNFGTDQCNLKLSVARTVTVDTNDNEENELYYDVDNNMKTSPIELNQSTFKLGINNYVNTLQNIAENDTDLEDDYPEMEILDKVEDLDAVIDEIQLMNHNTSDTIPKTLGGVGITNHYKSTAL